MTVHASTKGLNLPILGDTSAGIHNHKVPEHVALLGADYPGVKPKIYVQVGDEVKRGEPLFEDKRTPGVQFTSPGFGRIVAIHRGDRRSLESIVIALDPADQNGQLVEGQSLSFNTFQDKSPALLNRDEVRSLLLESGQWTAIRSRPFGSVANPSVTPNSLFVTAMDTNPLAPRVKDILEGREQEFETGLVVLQKLLEGKVYVCTADDDVVQVPSFCSHEQFKGPHPAGNVGHHIHRLDPVNRHKTVWHINYQDVIATGFLFNSGSLDFRRVVSLAGPAVSEPRQIWTRVGASTDQMVENEDIRIVSGSVLSGRKAMGEVHGYLGRYHQQISVIPEGRDREFLGWLSPGKERFSVKRLFLSTFRPNKKFSFTTTTYGSKRAIVPIGSYEQVMPMEILPTFLLRALVMQDVERAEQLGCLELEEEDVALCSFVCPSKVDYGVYLRSVLTKLEKEG